MFLAQTVQTVHTSGINWESIAVIATAVLAIVGAFVTWIGNRITHAINDMSVQLQLKLESKEVVSGIDKRLIRVEQLLIDRKDIL